MLIATYNINGVRARWPVLCRWLESARPDIVCLQELKALEEQFPADAIADLGYGALWHGQKAWNGVAILALNETPREICRALPGDPEDEHSRYVEAIAHGMRTASLYLPNGNPAPGPKFDYKLRWLDRLKAHAAELARSDEPTVLAGDFNVIPADLDVFAPERWRNDALFRPEVRRAYAELLELGWVDALRSLHPTERIYSFWKYFPGAFERDQGLRIDHFLLNAAAEGRLRATGVERRVRAWERTSDHAPVWIEVEN
jgi:exodeoxyribonuclease III